MRKMNAARRYEVISLRISSEELQVIRNLRNEATPNISEVLRLALTRLIQDKNESDEHLQNERGAKEKKMQQVFDSMQESYRPGSFNTPTTFYFSIDEVKKTVTLDNDSCRIQEGKTVDQADCVCKMGADMLGKIWNSGYRPGVMDFMGGKIKSNAPHLLQQFLTAFGK